jgi:hypothetical protein
MTDRTWQGRAHKDLRAAHLLLDIGHEEATVSRADYDLISVSKDDARAASDRAKIVVDTVDAWLAKR